MMLEKRSQQTGGVRKAVACGEQIIGKPESSVCNVVGNQSLMGGHKNGK